MDGFSLPPATLALECLGWQLLAGGAPLTDETRVAWDSDAHKEAKKRVEAVQARLEPLTSFASQVESALARSDEDSEAKTLFEGFLIEVRSNGYALGQTITAFRPLLNKLGVSDRTISWLLSHAQQWDRAESADAWPAEIRLANDVHAALAGGKDPAHYAEKMVGAYIERKCRGNAYRCSLFFDVDKDALLTESSSDAATIDWIISYAATAGTSCRTDGEKRLFRKLDSLVEMVVSAIKHDKPDDVIEAAVDDWLAGCHINPSLVVDGLLRFWSDFRKHRSRDLSTIDWLVWYVRRWTRTMPAVSTP